MQIEAEAVLPPISGLYKETPRFVPGGRNFFFRQEAKSEISTSRILKSTSRQTPGEADVIAR